MIVYTVQTEEAWKQFKKLGYLEGNKEVIDSDSIYSYDWMVRVAKTRLPHYEGNYPIWILEKIIIRTEIIKLGVEKIQKW